MYVKVITEARVGGALDESTTACGPMPRTRRRAHRVPRPRQEKGGLQEGSSWGKPYVGFPQTPFPSPPSQIRTGDFLMSAFGTSRMLIRMKLNCVYSQALWPG